MKKIAVIMVYLVFFMQSVFGASTLKWEFNSFEHFFKGEFFNVSLSEDGEMALSPHLQQYSGIDATYVWDIKSDSQGNLFLATGNNGIVYKIDTKGSVTKFFETASIAAFKILIDKNDNLYVATMTRGLVYKISPDGKGEVFYVFKGDHIWDMIFDEKGDIILATGIPGMLFRLQINTRELEEICMTKEMHILTVIQDKDGDFYFGTSDNGAIYKYTRNKKLKVVYQTGESEVHTLALRKDGIIFAGTSDKEFRFPGLLKNTTPQSSPQMEQKNEMNAYKKIKQPSNSVYKIMPSGYVTKIIEIPDTIFLSLIIDANDNLYVGSGDSGIIYRCNRQDRVEKLLEMDDQQVLCFYPYKDDIMIGTGNLGNVYRMGKNYSDFGNYVSEILDATSWARWGKIRWDWNSIKGTEITVQTRTGNIAGVDDTWSDWSEEYSHPKGSLIKSPDSQYIQFRINFKTVAKNRTPVLYSVEIPYLLKNRPPEITKLDLEVPDGNNKNEKDKKPRSTLKQWERRLIWDAKDPDNDKLVYSVYARIENSRQWVLLKRDLANKDFIFDIRKIPDGVYSFKIVADDMPDNSQGYNMTAEKVSKKYIIDTTAPVITKLVLQNLTVNSFKISGKATDNLSRIDNISYSVDAEKWINLFPKDMLFDSASEEFELVYKKKNKPTIIMIMVQDEWGNINTRYKKIK